MVEDQIRQDHIAKSYSPRFEKIGKIMFTHVHAPARSSESSPGLRREQVMPIDEGRVDPLPLTAQTMANAQQKFAISPAQIEQSSRRFIRESPAQLARHDAALAHPEVQALQVSA